MTFTAADLLPIESLALKMAIGQLERGENPPINTTATIAAALERITAAVHGEVIRAVAAERKASGELAAGVVDVAQDAARAAEREAIIQLAVDHGAAYYAEPRPCGHNTDCSIITAPRVPFADLIRKERGDE